jgi:uracil-DNA glycosylase
VEGAGVQRLRREPAAFPAPSPRVSTARLLIVGQAPGRRVHETGIPWNDPSGDLLRQWLGMTREQFYDVSRIAIVPTGLCYPGTVNGSDLPPRPECAPLWHPPLRAAMPDIGLTLLIGAYAQAHYLGRRRGRTLADTVHAWRDFLPEFSPCRTPAAQSPVVETPSWFRSVLNCANDRNTFPAGDNGGANDLYKRRKLRKPYETCLAYRPDGCKVRGAVGRRLAESIGLLFWAACVNTTGRAVCRSAVLAGRCGTTILSFAGASWRSGDLRTDFQPVDAAGRQAMTDSTLVIRRPGPGAGRSYLTAARAAVRGIQHDADAGLLAGQRCLRSVSVSGLGDRAATMAAAVSGAAWG